MRTILYLTEFFISKRLHIGILAVATTIYYMRILGVAQYHPLIPLVSFFIVWSAYLENLTTDKKEDALNRVPHGILPFTESRFYPIEKLYPLFYLSALVLSLFISVECFLYTFFAVVIWMSYVQRWLPAGKNKRKRLKEVFIIKNLVPPLGWLLSVGIIPFIAADISFIREYVLFALIIFVWACREEIKFDIPDIEGDQRTGIRTLPNTLGESQTKTILNIINYILLILLFGSLLILRENNHMIQFDSLLKNMLPLLTAFFYDHNFVNALFEKKKKEYCNVGIIWWTFLLAIYLVFPYPHNIYVYLSFRLTGSFSACSLLDDFLRRVNSQAARSQNRLSTINLQ